PEDALVHLAQGGRHRGPEAHLREHIAFNVHAGRYFNEGWAIFLQSEYGRLGDVQDLFARLAHPPAVEADPLDRLYGAGHAALRLQHQPAVFAGRLQVAGPEGAAEDDLLHAVADVHRAAGADPGGAVPVEVD